MHAHPTPHPVFRPWSRTLSPFQAMVWGAIRFVQPVRSPGDLGLNHPVRCFAGHAGTRTDRVDCHSVGTTTRPRVGSYTCGEVWRHTERGHVSDMHVAGTREQPEGRSELIRGSVNLSPLGTWRRKPVSYSPPLRGGVGVRGAQTSAQSLQLDGVITRSPSRCASDTSRPWRGDCSAHCDGRPGSHSALGT